MWESLSPEGNEISLLVTTISDQECLNSEIKSDIAVQNSKLVVQLDGIEQPADCLEGEAPALANLPLANLSTGNYGLEINILDIIKNEGTVEIDPTTLRIELTTDDGLHISHDELNRVPNNTYWGFIALDQITLNNVTADFLAEVETIRDEADLANGYYGHFNIFEDKVEFDAVTEYPDVDKFIFKYSGELNELIKLLDDYRAHVDYAGQLEIKVMTYQGLELYLRSS